MHQGSPPCGRPAHFPTTAGQAVQLFSCSQLFNKTTHPTSLPLSITPPPTPPPLYSQGPGRRGYWRGGPTRQSSAGTPTASESWPRAPSPPAPAPAASDTGKRVDPAMLQRGGPTCNGNQGAGRYTDILSTKVFLAIPKKNNVNKTLQIYKIKYFEIFW